MEFDNGSFGEICLNDQQVDVFGDFCGLNCEKEELCNDKGGKFDKCSDDIVSLLPHDPSNMDDDQLFGELSFVLTGTMRIHRDAGLEKIDGNCRLLGMDFGEGSDSSHGLVAAKREEVMGFSYEKYWLLRDTTINDQRGRDDRCNMDGADPSDALLLALGYLSLGDLLAVERVCKSVRDAVRGDPLLWRSIHIDYPLSTKITDDILIKLTNRAQGHLHSLSLVCCSKITDDGLKHVLERNPCLTKLSVPGCVRLTIDGILSSLKGFKSAGKPKLKYLGIYGVFGVTNQHFEEFKLLLAVDNSKLRTTRRPRYFGVGQLCANSDDDRAMDIEVCPICQQLGLVYDCPSESCQKKQSASQLCRACAICITRCVNCGCCLNNCEYEELFSFDLLCLDCWRQLLGGQESEQKMTLPKTTVLHKQAGYRFYLCG